MKILYDFQCEECQFHMEERVKSSVRNLECPECDGNMKRLISAPPFILKGSGWAQDDKKKRQARKKAQAKFAKGEKPMN